MKKRFLIFGTLLLLHLIPIGLRAQINMGANVGPFDIYVSEQGNNPDPIKSGQYSATADEGRVVNVGIMGIKGPIKVDPMNYVLNGPPCPTYDIHGRRSPENPVPPIKKDFTGNISIDANNIPAAGTTVPAEFSAKDNGYWTRCSKNEQVSEPAVRTVKFNIISIKLTMADNNITLCRDNSYNVLVKSTYPAAMGTVDFASDKGKFSITKASNTGCTITGIADGKDVLIANYTVQGVSYKIKIPVNVNFIKFKDNKATVYAWAPGNTKDATQLLTPESNKDNLKWSLKFGNGNGSAKIDENTGLITFPTVPGATYTLTVAFKNAPDCKITKQVIFMGYDILVQNSKSATTCDGTPNIQVSVVPIPNTLAVAELAKFGVITLTSKTVTKDFGNEEGTSDLNFTALDANFQATIDHAIWYKTAAAGCNYFSTHLIQGQAQVDGINVNTPMAGKPDAKLTTNLKCINGKAIVVKAFAGAPQLAFGPGMLANSVRCVVSGWGTFARDVQAEASWWGPATSQFMPFVIAEENFHKTNQFENPKHPLMVDLYDPKLVMNGAAALWWDGPNAAVSQAMVMQAFVGLCNAEFMRSSAFFSYPSPRRCALEKEAKQNTGIKFGFNFKCAYPLCP